MIDEEATLSMLLWIPVSCDGKTKCFVDFVAQGFSPEKSALKG
jgi:hypothetical protein